MVHSNLFLMQFSSSQILHSVEKGEQKNIFAYDPYNLRPQRLLENKSSTKLCAYMEYFREDKHTKQISR